MSWTRPRDLARAVIALSAAAAMTLTAAAPASAHGDADRVEKKRAEYSEGTNIPLITSSNVNLVSTFPESAGISGCFAKSAPYFYMSTLDSISVFDVSDPLSPTLTGTVDNIAFENEAMNCGERRTRDGVERFVLVGNDLYDVSSSDIQHSAGSVGGNELVIVDVTDPAAPHIRSRMFSTTGTHTVACVVDTDCRYVYSSGGGRGDKGVFSIFDISDLDKPVELDSDPGKDGIQPFESPTAGHKWNFDDAQVGTHTGYSGSGLFDVSDPADPKLLATTGAAGDSDRRGAKNGYNNFIHHNSFRPNAKAFRPNTAASLENGNILLVTEEDYMETDCSLAGSFQTWHVKELKDTDGKPDIVPLAKLELADLGTFPLPHGAFCSAHWFDYHQSGIVAIGYYGGGTHFIDVRKPKEPKSHGYATWGVSEVWDSYFVPVYNKRDHATGKKTNIAYSVDLVRGLDVYVVELPGDKDPTGVVSLGSTNPFAVFSWPEDALPIGLVLMALVGSFALRRRAGARIRG